MENHLIALLDNAGLLKGNQVVEGRLRNISAHEIIELATQASEITSAERVGREDSSFTFTSSLSLAGGSDPCFMPSCRLQRVKELGQFAALYGDRVYVKCFLSDYVTNPSNVVHVHDDAIRESFAIDVAVLAYLRPLIEARRIVPVTPPTNRCPYCLSSHILFDERTSHRLNNAYKKLERRYFHEVEQRANLFGDELLVGLRGPDDLLEHGGGGHIFRRTPDFIKTMPTVYHRLRRGGELVLSPTVRKQLGLHSRLTSSVINNVVFELAMTQSLNTRLLTERQLEVDVLNGISGDVNVGTQNELIRKHLTLLLPFVAELEPTDLLRLRKGEEEALILFRKALSQAVDQVKGEGTMLDSKRLKAIYGDVLEPGLARLDAKIKTARGQLVRGTLRKAGAWTGAISFGMFTGLLPPTLVAAASALGLVKVVAELAELAMKVHDQRSEIQSDELYFLWRVRQIARTRRENRPK